VTDKQAMMLMLEMSMLLQVDKPSKNLQKMIKQIKLALVKNKEYAGLANKLANAFETANANTYGIGKVVYSTIISRVDYELDDKVKPYSPKLFEKVFISLEDAKSNLSDWEEQEADIFTNDIVDATFKTLGIVPRVSKFKFNKDSLDVKDSK